MELNESAKTTKESSRSADIALTLDRKRKQLNSNLMVLAKWADDSTEAPIKKPTPQPSPTAVKSDANDGNEDDVKTGDVKTDDVKTDDKSEVQSGENTGDAQEKKDVPLSDAAVKAEHADIKPENADVMPENADAKLENVKSDAGAEGATAVQEISGKQEDVGVPSVNSTAMDKVTSFKEGPPAGSVAAPTEEITTEDKAPKTEDTGASTEAKKVEDSGAMDVAP